MLFNFEMDFADSLRCIPMMVQMNLDLCGVKVSLRQWNRFTREDRAALVSRPTDSAEQREKYRVFLIDLIRRRAEEEPVLLPPVTSAAWQKADKVPQSIKLAAASHGVGSGLIARTRRLQRGRLPRRRRWGICHSVLRSVSSL